MGRAESVRHVWMCGCILLVVAVVTASMNENPVSLSDVEPLSDGHEGNQQANEAEAAQLSCEEHDLLVAKILGEGGAKKGPRKGKIRKRNMKKESFEDGCTEKREGAEGRAEI